MKVEINYVGSTEEEGAVINTVSLTEELKGAIDILENNCRVIPVTKDGENVIVTEDNYSVAEVVDFLNVYK